jgi:hypothetical protein
MTTTLTIERQKAKRERLERQGALRREAIGAALEWMSPMRDASTKGSLIALATVRGDADEDHIRKDWPDLLSDLIKTDLNGAQRAMLPEGIYARGHKIHADLEELRLFALNESQSKHIQRPPMAGFNECSSRIEAIDRAILALEGDLRREFKASF